MRKEQLPNLQDTFALHQMPEPTDLFMCDQEPIHIPGTIQPHGVLLAVDPAGLIVQQVAGDTGRYLARDTADVLGLPLDRLLGAEGMHSLASLEPEMAEPLYLGSVSIISQRLDLTVHYAQGVLILELEPASAEPKSAAQLLGSIRRIIGTWEATDGLGALLVAASEEFRRLTGFDRVMIYRFLEDGTGAVVSEAKAESMDALLNHHYPASDIPKQARALYLRNPIRVIPEADYLPASLVPRLNPATGQTLDMSDSVLRSVSPIHVQYLKNMNVAASMSISIVIKGALWGLVSCHHTSARHVAYELRETCKLLGQNLSQLIKSRLEDETACQAQHLASARDRLLEKLQSFGLVEESFREYLEEVQHLLQADGVAFLARGKLMQKGSTPAEPQTRELIDWLVSSAHPATFTTDRLSEHHQPARRYSANASGLLATVISYKGPFVVLWFRAEYIETILWAGNPHKAVEPGAEPGQLNPRSSFEEWKETVRNRSRPWSVPEIDSAKQFGRAVTDMRLQDTLQGLNRQLQKTLADQDVLLARTVSLKEEALSQVRILNKKEVELRTILEHTSDVYIRMDEAGIVTAWNQKAEEVFQWSRSEAIGKPLEGLIIPPGMREAYRNDMQRFLATGQSYIVGNVREVPVSRRDGLLMIVELRATAIKIHDRTIFSAFVRERSMQAVGPSALSEDPG